MSVAVHQFELTTGRAGQKTA